MNFSRRDLLRAGLGLGAVVGIGLAAGCSTAPTTSGSTGRSTGAATETDFWYWGGGLSDKVVAEAKTKFAAQTTIKPSVIGGDFKQKLQTTLTGGRFVPAITGVKGEDIAYFRSVGSKFTDLNQFGTADLAAKGLSWKWKQAQDTQGRQLGYPIDVGPTAMFYRADLFDQAGLPTDPTEVGNQVKTWDAFYELGQQLHGKVSSTYPVSSLGMVWTIVTGQTSQRFVSQDNTFVGDSDELRQAWDTTVKAQKLGLNANAAQSFNPALAKGKIGIEMGAAWHALDISSGAPKTSGKWRVATNPVKPTNFGGSFLTIPAGTKDAKLAFDIISWVLSPANEAQGYTDAAIFPADPEAWTLSALTGGDAFFGGQKTIEIFGPSAKLVPSQYEAATDAAVSAPYSDELTKIETAGKDPDQAWSDAVSAAKQVAARQGVK